MSTTPSKQTPQVSILMPVRNEAPYLIAALDSVRGQTFQDWELIAVDDGSTDCTPEILARYAASDSRITLVRTAGVGLVPALNQGLAACRGPLIARMDGDDISHENRLAEQVAFLAAHPAVGLVACSFKQFSQHEIGSGMAAYEQWQNQLLSHETIMADLFVESPFVHPSIMVRRQVMETVGGYREMGWAEDYDLWLRMAAAGVHFARLPQTLFFWREHPQRATRTSSLYSLEAFRRCKLHHLRHGFLKGEKQVWLAGAGKEGRAWQRILLEAGIRVIGWVDVDPRKIGRELHGAPVLATGDINPDGIKLLLTVGTRGARDGVRQWARQAGFEEGVNAVCVA